MVPEGVNLSSSDAVAIGAIVVRNDARSDVMAKIENAAVTALDGNVSVSATEDTTIIATTDATATASGGSAYGTGMVIGASGIVATNMVLSQADAYLDNSIVTASDADDLDADQFGNVIVDAQNTSLIDATVLNSVTSGDTSAGVTLAFNTVGWQAQNILFQALDALISTDIGTEQKAGMHAYAFDSTLTADGDVKVTANSEAQINADVGNEAAAAAAALYGASSAAISGLLASNMVSSEADAYIHYTADMDSNLDVDAGVAVTVQANEKAEISASTRMLAKGSSTNDAGTSLINNFADALLTEYHYTTNSGTQKVKPLEMVRLADNYTGGTGAPGVVYMYNGADESNLNLGNQNYAGNPLWVRFEAVDIVPAFGNISDSNSAAVGGLVVRNDVRGGVDASIEKAKIEAAALNVNALENATITAQTLSAAEASGGSAFGTGTVIAGNGTAATNLVLSHADAWVNYSDITTTVGDIKVDARNTSMVLV